MPEPPPHVLFLSTRNGCRSQMAEAWTRALSGGKVRASSAGTEPAQVGAVTVTTMAEAGIDVSAQHPKPLSEIDLGTVTHVITVCEAAAAACPAFAHGVVRRHWPVPDPSDMPSEFEHLTADGFRAIRDNLRDRARMFLVELGLTPVDPPPPAIDSAGGAA